MKRLPDQCARVSWNLAFASKSSMGVMVSKPPSAMATCWRLMLASSMGSALNEGLIRPVGSMEARYT